MIGTGKSYSQIIAYANKHGLHTSARSLSSHSKKHRALTPDEIEEKSRSFRNSKAAKVQFGRKTEAIVSANKCLEDIITYAYERMATGDVKPTIDNALKAIELQARLKETGILESKIIDFMLEFTREGIESKRPDQLQISSCHPEEEIIPSHIVHPTAYQPEQESVIIAKAEETAILSLAIPQPEPVMP